jgi:transcriptional regulator with XRE-family HTH domain
MDIYTRNFNMWVDNELEIKGWSLRELSRRCGVSQPHLSLIKSGDRSVTWDVVAAVSKAFGIRPETGFRLVGLLPPSKSRFDELNEIISILSDDDIAEIIKYASFRAGKKMLKKIA